MRLAKYSRTLLMAALPAVLAASAFAQEHPNVSPNAVRDQLMKGGSPAQTTLPANAPQPRKSPAPAKAGKGASAKSTAAAKSPAEKPAEEKISTSRRDPFDTLLNRARAATGTPENLPPGKAGLVVASLRIDGIVHNTGGMIAIVSNPQMRVYFLREGDKLYDGSVDKITLDSVSFHELGKDAFGKTLEHQVTKRLYPSPGESQ